jgi:hypothetical protein
VNHARWTAEDVARLVEATQMKWSAVQAAGSLDRTSEAVRQKAREIGVTFRYEAKSEDEKLRERWIALLPAMKAALRRDIEINTSP